MDISNNLRALHTRPQSQQLEFLPESLSYQLILLNFGILCITEIILPSMGYVRYSRTVVTLMRTILSVKSMRRPCLSPVAWQMVMDTKDKV